jgi:hypothetical protein
MLPPDDSTTVATTDFRMSFTAPSHALPSSGIALPAASCNIQCSILFFRLFNKRAPRPGARGIFEIVKGITLVFAPVRSELPHLAARRTMFDPYHKWLGIPPKDQPPNYYRLLAIDLFESDPEVIDAAANRQMAYVQQRASGEHMAESQKLLNELSTARLCLLDQKKKSAYDLQLRVNVRQQARRSGEGHKDKPPKSLHAAGVMHEELPSGHGLQPPVRRVKPPPIEETSDDEAGYTQGITKHLVFLGGGLLLVVALLCFLYIRPGAGKNNTAPPVPDNQGGATQGGNAEKPPENAPAAIYYVEIDPPSATLTVQNNMANVTGSGRTREIRFDNIPWRVYPLVAASCEGYKSYSQRLSPKAGQSENLSIKLDRLSSPPSTSIANSSPNAGGQSSTSPGRGGGRPIDPRLLSSPGGGNSAGSQSAAGSDRLPIIAPGGGRPKDPMKDHSPTEADGSKTERRKFYVFSGESAIKTPAPRSLPSTVEAWIWYSKTAQPADMYVFGSEDLTKPSIGGLGLRIDHDGQLGGSRMQRNKQRRDIWTSVLLPAQKWTHLAATFDKDKIAFFVDGHLVRSDKGSQEEGSAKFVVGYIGIGTRIPTYCFQGRMRNIRISSGIRYTDDFDPPPEFNKRQDKEGFKTILIYDAANGMNDQIPDLSGNKKDGVGLNITIVEE